MATDTDGGGGGIVGFSRIWELAIWDLRRSASRRRTGRSKALTLDYLTLYERSLGRYPEIIEDHVRGIVAR